MKFSPTVPTNLRFEGPPVTPSDTTIGHVRMPIPTIIPPKIDLLPILSTSIQQQFWQTLVEPWQKPLFGSIRKAGSPNMFYRLLRAQQPLLLVSDASVQKNGRSGFAWVLAAGPTPLWRGLGLAPGPFDDIHSGRAEAFGLLAALIFIQQYLSYYPPLELDTTIKCYCDNSGVITNLTNLQREMHIRPNDTTNNDMDLYLEIIANARACPHTTFPFIHVKGHQDTKRNHQLTTPEQHNVDCDRRAKLHVQQQQPSSTLYKTPDFAVARPHLRIKGKIICRDFFPTLRQNAATPEYWEYLKKRFQWTHADAATIHWKSLQTALESFQRNDQRCLILFIHGKLPLRTSKFHPHAGSQLCPSCQREPEDRRHFLACTHPAKRRLFDTLKTQLAALSTKYQLHPSILTAFWLGLRAARHDTRYPDSANDLPIELQQATRYQTRLGWDQLYYGRMTQHWISAIDQLNPHLTVHTHQILAQLIKTVWNYVLEVWQLRNLHLHNDAGHLSLPDYRQAVRTIYETRSQLPPTAQEALFHIPLETLLEQTPAFLRVWIERSQRYVQQQLKAAKTRAKLNTQDIRLFFRNATATNDLQPP